MKRKISSGQTFYSKVLGVPIVLAYLFFWLLRGGIDLPFLIMMLAIWGISLWSCVKLKRVSIDDDYLYVTNFLKGIVVPLSEIEEVKQNKWYQSKFVKIKLRHPTEFGSEILFMPKGSFYFMFGKHPVVEEIKDLAREAYSRQLGSYTTYNNSQMDQKELKSQQR